MMTGRGVGVAGIMDGGMEFGIVGLSQPGFQFIGWGEGRVSAGGSMSGIREKMRRSSGSGSSTRRKCRKTAKWLENEVFVILGRMPQLLCGTVEREDRKEILMSLAPISSSSPVPVNTEVAKPVTPPPAAPSAAAAPSQDTVTISAAGRAASTAGDVDHDGDSH